MRRLFATGLVSILLILLQAQTGLAQESIPRFELADCPIEVPDEPPIDCGYLVVPEDYGEPNGTTIRLPVIIIHSRSKNPAPDPILFTEGGPGFSSLTSVGWFASTSFVDDRDIVILEQRGNFYAKPSLTCDISVLWEEGEGNTSCLDSLKSRGIDLTHYTTQSIASDIDALRQTLDYDDWNLYGTSYSTRLMQLTMHLHPEGIRSVILQSVSPITDTRYKHDPEHTLRALNVMFEDCAADPACAVAYPDLEAQFYRVFNRLNAEPVQFEFYYSPLDYTFSESVSGYRLLGWMDGNAFYHPTRPPYQTAYLPLLIDQLEQGKNDLLYPWLESDLDSIFSGEPWAWGLYFAVNCQNDAAGVTAEEIAARAVAFPELEGYVRHGAELAICDAWGLPAAPPLADEPVVSDIPTLVLAGSYDPITPPEWSKAVADNLSNSYYYEFPSSGHGVIEDNPCAQSIIAAFVDDPTTRPDASCMADVPAPEFVLPQDVIIASGIYEIHYREIGYSQHEENLFLGSLIVFMIGVVYAIIAGVVWWVRRKRHPTPDRLALIAHLLAGVFGALNIGYSFALRAALRATAASAPNVLRFGLPVKYWPLFVVPPITALLSVVLIVFTFIAWRRQYWTVVGRIIFSLTTLAAIIFTGLLAHWGMITAFL